MENKLPKNWVNAKLNDLSTIQSGGTPSRSKKQYWSGDIPWVKISDLKEWYVNSTTEFITEEGLNNSSTKLFPKGTILFTIFATIGKVGVLDIEACTNQAIAGITPVESIEHKFLTYSLIELSEILKNEGKGVAQKNINLTILKDLNVPLPPLAEQQRIVNKLDTIFKHLDALKTRLDNIPKLLKNFRQAILTQAVTGKLTEEWRVGKELEDTSINVNLGSYLTEIKYGTSKKSDYGVDGMPILRIPNIKDGEIDTSDLKFSILDEKEYQKVLLKKGDVLVIRSNGSISIVGKTAIVRHQKEMGYAGYLVRLRSGEKLNSEYLNYMLSSPNLRRQIEEKARSTSGVNNINTTEIKELKINVFDIKEQTEIVKRVEHLFAKADAIEAQYQSLKTKIDSLPQAILAKAFKGELVEQLDTDGDAKELLAEIQKLKTSLRGTKQSQPKKKKS